VRQNAINSNALSIIFFLLHNSTFNFFLIATFHFQKSNYKKLKQNAINYSKQVNESTLLFLVGLIRQPKYGHLKELHKVIKQCEPALVSSDPIVTSLGSLQEVFSFKQIKINFPQKNYFTKYLILFFQAHVFSPKSQCAAAFLSNYDPKNVAKVMFNNKHYTLPPWSTSILPDCKDVAFNTAQVCKFLSSFFIFFYIKFSITFDNILNFLHRLELKRPKWRWY